MDFKLTCLAFSFLLSYTSAIKLCDLEEESCVYSAEFNEYTFSTMINDCYDAVKDYFGIGVDTVEETVHEGDTTEKFDFSDAEINAFIKRAEDITTMLAQEQGMEAKVDKFSDMLREALDSEVETTPEKHGEFEFHPMHKLEPGTVGQVKTIELTDGRKTSMTTLAKQPPLFEIEQFLTDEECDSLLEAAKKFGTSRSGVFVDTKGFENGKQISNVRVSNSSQLIPPHIEEKFLKEIHRRISSITQIPMYVIEGSEPLTIGYYAPGGFYSAHLDSNEAPRKKIPCCFQSACKDESGQEREANDCCSMCRYATFLYYLTDVEEGGETAFPFADLTMSELITRQTETPDWANLTTKCYDATVVVKPARGKAIFWYSHFLDTKGYLSGVDKRSNHGGCNVTRGSKWIATNWISSPIYSHRFIPSRHRDISTSYKEYVDSL